MKKVAYVVILGLFLQIAPVKVFAASSGGGAGLVILALLTDGMGLLPNPKEKASAAQKEFASLNGMVQNSVLLKQAAGGELNTLDILK